MHLIILAPFLLIWWMLLACWYISFGLIYFVLFIFRGVFCR